MFDVYLSNKRDRLLVVPKGMTAPLGEPLTRWRKKRSVARVSEEIRLAVQKNGYYGRRSGEIRQPLTCIEALQGSLPIMRLRFASRAETEIGAAA